MINDEYLERKFNEAKVFLRKTVGLKPCYFEQDVFMVLKEFGYVENLVFDDLMDYLPVKGYDFSSLEAFTHGYITSNINKIYAVRMDKHFNIFIVSFNEYREVTDYYSVTVSEETLGICFILESMKFKV